MSWLSNTIGIDMNYYDFIMKKRENKTEFLANIIIDKHKETNLPICILGTAFKPNTNIENGSPTVLLKNILVKIGYSVETYYPNICKDNKEYKISDKLYFIGCKHDIFTTYVFTERSYIIDVNRYISHNQGSANITYVGVGNKI